MKRCTPLRYQCQWNGNATRKPLQVSVLLHPLVVGRQPIQWRDWNRRANERLLVALAALPESRLQEPDWWTFGRALGSVFDVDHDREHAQDIQRWLGQS